jgi:hypothetical protein
MIPFSKRWRVRRWARKCWWDGFLAGVGGQTHWIGSMYEGPRWWQDVRQLAYDAGVDHARDVIAKRDERTVSPERDIPADVLATCYAAASR